MPQAMLLGEMHDHATTSVGPVLAWALPALVLLVPAAAYLALTLRWSARRGQRWSLLRTASWLLGLVLVAAALAPPLSAAARHDPVAHMAQHLLIGMYGPLALVLAAPVTLILGATTTRTARRLSGLLRTPVVHTLAHPAVATALSAGGLWVLYATPLLAVTMASPLVHHLVLLHLVASGCLFTWAVAGPDPAPRRPGLPVRIGALLVSAASHALLAKTLYARAGEWPPGAHGSVERLQDAARLMYYGGDVAEVLLAVVLLAWWYRRTAPRPAGLVPRRPQEV